MKNMAMNQKLILLMLLMMLLIYGIQGASYGQVCNVGDVLSPGGSCTYPGTDATFSVLDNGNARWNIPDFPLFNRVSIAGSLNFTATINGKRYHFVAAARAGNSWEIVEIGNTVNTVDDGDDPARDSENQPDGVTASTVSPLTELTLDGAVVTLTLSGGTFERSSFRIRDAVTVSGISGVTVGTFDIDRQSDTQITVELTFDGTDFDTTSTLTFTVGAGAIANYSGSGFTAQVPVASNVESLVASTAAPLTEATLNESVVTLTLSGRTYERSIFKIKDAVTVSGISGVTVGTFDIDRRSDTQITVELTFSGNINTDSVLTFTVGAGAIANYSGSGFTAQVPVSTITESLVASTAAPLTEATLHESVVTLTLSGGTYARSRITIGNAVTVSGITGVKIGTFGPAWFGVDRVSDTKITVELGFTGNIDTDATLTFTVGAGAIANYNGPALTAQILVAAGGESSETDNNPTPNVDVSVTTGGADDDTDRQPPDPPPTTTQTPTTTETPNQPNSGQSVSLTASPHRARAELDGSVVTLTLSGGTYAHSIFDIRGAVTVSGISGVTVEPDRESDTEITVELDFTGSLNTNATLTFTVGAGAIANYNGPALTAQIPVVTLITQEIQGPWLWMVVPTDSTAGTGISTEIDSLAAASGSTVTETHVARNGANAGNQLGQQRWTSSIVQSKRVCIKYDIFFCPDPTVCWEDNINNVVSTLGMGSGANTNGDTAYALINLYLPHQQSNVLLTVKSGDAIKVWLNGNVVHRDDAESYDCRKIDVPWACDPRVCVSDPAVQESDVHSIAVTLNLGNNLLLVKVRQHGEYWGMNVGLAADFTTAIPTAQTDGSVSAPDTVTGDANNDGVVNITDLVLVASNYGQSGQNTADVNGDGVVDIKDLTIVASAIDNAAAAPLAQPQLLDMFTTADVKRWLSHAQQLDLTDTTVQRGIVFLEQLLAALLPRETVLLPNYPNPFNPETWIPYRLAEDAFVTLTIYDSKGRVVRTLEVGHRIAAVYESRSKAIYWDGRNEFGETVASGVFFYHLSAGDYSATRKLVILK